LYSEKTSINIKKATSAIGRGLYLAAESRHKITRGNMQTTLKNNQVK
jgi:hypothetical protein